VIIDMVNEQAAKIASLRAEVARLKQEPRTARTTGGPQ
jgi:uncharacterized small protein (DUF1192 family)